MVSIRDANRSWRKTNRQTRVQSSEGVTRNEEFLFCEEQSDTNTDDEKRPLLGKCGGMGRGEQREKIEVTVQDKDKTTREPCQASLTFVMCALDEQDSQATAAAHGHTYCITEYISV